MRLQAGYVESINTPTTAYRDGFVVFSADTISLSQRLTSIIMPSQKMEEQDNEHPRQ
jgi:hypothetical protein